MKFDRKYEPAILVYRETRPPGRILMRLGRLGENGSRDLEEDARVPRNFAFTTYILSKDPRTLLERLNQKLGRYSTNTKDGLQAVMVDYPSLRAALENDENSHLRTSIESLWGTAALAEILDIPLLTTRVQRHKIRRMTATGMTDPKREKPPLPEWLPYALSGFAMIVALPIIILLAANPNEFISTETTRPTSFPDRAGDIPPDRTRTPADPETRQREREMTRRLNAKKQQLFIAAKFGPLDPSSGTTHAIPRQASLPRIPRPDNRTTYGSRSARPGAGGDQQAGNPGNSGIPDLADIQRVSKTEGDMATDRGIPTDIANFRLRDISLYRVSRNQDAETSWGMTAEYEISRDIDVIFQAVETDMSNLSEAIDTTVRGICTTLTGDVTNTVAEINILFGAARSMIAAMSITPGTCENATYKIFPMFDPVEKDRPGR